MLFTKSKILTGALASLLLSATGLATAPTSAKADEMMMGGCNVSSDYVEIKGIAHCFTGDVVMIDVEGIGPRTVTIDSTTKSILGLVPGMRLSAYAKQKGGNMFDLQCLRVISMIDAVEVDTDAIRAEIRSKLELPPRKVASPPPLTPRTVTTPRRPVTRPRTTAPRPVRGLW